jgi:hypothetical protein
MTNVPCPARVGEPSDRRQGYIDGLRALADALAAYPELMLPIDGYLSGMSILSTGEADQREQLAAWARVLPGRKTKSGSDRYFRFDGAFAGLKIQVVCDRDVVCERVVIATREVTEDVPDPEALAAVPTVSVTKTVEDVEWRCSPVLVNEPTGDAR